MNSLLILYWIVCGTQACLLGGGFGAGWFGVGPGRYGGGFLFVLFVITLIVCVMSTFGGIRA